MTYLKSAGRIAWSVLAFVLRLVWAIVRFAGRVALWLVFWPAAMYRAHQKRADKRNAKLLAALSKAAGN